MKFAIIDTANMFNRAFHGSQSDAYTKAGMAMHIIFNSLAKLNDKYSVDHLVFCGEGKSWRYSYYSQYKANRVLKKKMQTPIEREEQEVMYEVQNDFLEFIRDQTRCTFLQSPRVEADDLIARFIQIHPDDEHIVLSADSDMIQLVDKNVSVYNGLIDRLITHNGVFDDKGREVVFAVNTSNGKVKIGELVEEARKKHDAEIKTLLRNSTSLENAANKTLLEAQQEFDAIIGKSAEKAQASRNLTKAKKSLAEVKVSIIKAQAQPPYEFTPETDWVEKSLFIKCIRGDSGDGIFSAFPNVRYKGSAGRMGIVDAWNDRKDKGFAWNNFMLQTWDKLLPDGSSKTVTVRDEYEINQILIDLTKQPSEIKQHMDEVIVDAIQKPLPSQVGIRFMQFCGKYELIKLAENAKRYTVFLNAKYQ